MFRHIQRIGLDSTGKRSILAGMTRLDQLKDKLAARLKPDGSPLPGYKRNVAELRAEIARRESAKDATAAQPGPA